MKRCVEVAIPHEEGEAQASSWGKVGLVLEGPDTFCPWPAPVPVSPAGTGRGCSWGVCPLLFTLLTYFWPLISKGLSCVPTLPSGPITACLINQACLSPTPPISSHVLPLLLAPPPSRGGRGGPRGEPRAYPELPALQDRCPGDLVLRKQPRSSPKTAPGYPAFPGSWRGGQAYSSLQGMIRGRVERGQTLEARNWPTPSEKVQGLCLHFTEDQRPCHCSSGPHVPCL